MRALLFVDRDRRNYNVSVQSVHNGAISISYPKSKVEFWILISRVFHFCMIETHKKCHAIVIFKKGKFNYDLHWNRIKIKCVKKARTKFLVKSSHLTNFLDFNKFWIIQVTLFFPVKLQCDIFRFSHLTKIIWIPIYLHVIKLHLLVEQI